MLGLFACGAEKTNNENSSNQEAHDEVDEYVDEFEAEEKPELINEEDLSETNRTDVFSCYVGLYQQQCVMLLNYSYSDIVGDYNVEGFYYYAKHQKKINLSGTYDVGANFYQLTESYKGKTSGYFEFYTDENADQNFWSSDLSEGTKQELKCELLTSYPASVEDISIQTNKYATEHMVNYDPLYEDPQTATDVLNTINIGEDYLAFYYYIISYSQNIGSVSGIAKMQGKSKAVWEDENGFTLNFSLYPDRIEVESVNYEEMTYGGFGVHFGGTYYRI